MIGEARDGLELLSLVKKLLPDMVILDISMPKIRGIEATREIKIIDAKIKVLILTMHKSREYLFHAISAGAEGYLLKEDADSELFSAIDNIRRGKAYISPILNVELADNFIRMCRGDHKQPAETLTSREREVLKLIAEGQTNKKIADLLFISIRTVENHRANIMRKLRFKNTSDIVKYAIRKKYISI
ncbi:MAG: response regulator transcription factor [Deltaproteobacteria bacterium]|nr:response regulator transcription factor [Deltaproteobacteria bacterium]